MRCKITSFWPISLIDSYQNRTRSVPAPYLLRIYRHGLGVYELRSRYGAGTVRTIFWSVYRFFLFSNA